MESRHLRFHLPIVIVVFTMAASITAIRPVSRLTLGFVRNARYDKLIEAFGGTGHHVTDTASSRSGDRFTESGHAGAH